MVLTAAAGALVILVRINMQFDQPQGRYLFPALPAIALTIAVGLESWRVPARLTALTLAAVNALILIFVVIPAYPPSVPALSKALAAIDVDVDARSAKGEWAADVRIAAEDARFVIFDLEKAGDTSASETSGSELQGAAVVTLDAGDPRNITLPFTWLNDGQRHTIYLTLLPHAPTGTVTRIRIRPGSGNAAVRQLRVAGSIPSHDF
jgi:hypothetical protein